MTNAIKKNALKCDTEKVASKCWERKWKEL